MNLLQKLFGSSKKAISDDSQQYSIDDYPGVTTASGSPRDALKNVSYQSSSSVEVVDGNVVSSESSESLSVWGD